MREREGERERERERERVITVVYINTSGVEIKKAHDNGTRNKNTKVKDDNL